MDQDSIQTNRVYCSIGEQEEAEQLLLVDQPMMNVSDGRTVDSRRTDSRKQIRTRLVLVSTDLPTMDLEQCCLPRFASSPTNVSSDFAVVVARTLCSDADSAAVGVGDAADDVCGQLNLHRHYRQPSHKK